MQFQVIRAASTRITETSSATMTTLASPTQGGTEEISLWQVALVAEANGPMHIVDTEQIWTLLSGEATCSLGDTLQHLYPGDTICIPPGIARQFSATNDSTFMVCGKSAVAAWVPGGAEPVTPPWVR